MRNLMCWLILGVMTGGILFKAAAQNPGAQKDKSPATWTDSATGLIWTAKDNGADVNWKQATSYCSDLKLGGNSNWRLPTIDELVAIYEPTSNQSVKWYDGQIFILHVKGNLKLSGWHWSSSSGNAEGEAFDYGFATGDRFSDDKNYSDGGGRALCVRK